MTVGYDSDLQNRGTLFLIKRKQLVKEKKMFKRTALFVFALLFLVNSLLQPLISTKPTRLRWRLYPGVGAAKAAAIIEYRTQHGNFKTKEDLLQVKGIGPKMLEKMQKEIEI